MLKLHKRVERYVLFSEVARLLSFSKAAESLNISRSYLSGQITRLEKELGLDLLIRSTRSVRLTPDGMKVLSEVQNINGSIINLERELTHKKSAVSGLLTITAPEVFSQSFLAEICKQFQEQHTSIRFTVDVGFSQRDLTQSHYDLAIRSTNNPPENMIAKKLLSYQHICCASPEYLAIHGTPRHPIDLHKHQCLSDPMSTKWPFFDGEKKLSIETQGAFLANNHFLMLSAALNGQGIIKAPDYLLKPKISSGELLPVLDNYFISKNDIYLIYPQLLQRSAALSAFIDYLMHYFKHNNLTD
ncbi:LysR family transcriptional regulator [Photobacterium makurazakiensis]|uniref:LysR family transcriptional regulator n=1 Tax=Photobacterium makurazakiensis TaxID=2910234 RepID=UPI003D107113